MSLHFAWIARLKEFGARMQASSDSGDKVRNAKEEEDDRIMISQAIIKCADISNPVNPFPFQQDANLARRILVI